MSKKQDLTPDLESFKELCNKVLDRSGVDKDEARAGVLGYCSIALLVVALDYIEELEKVPNKETLIAMLEVKTGKNLVECNSVEELFEELNRPE